MKKTLLALALAAGLTSFAGSAKAGLTYNWSFSGFNNSNVSGLLTLDNTQTQADSVYVNTSTRTYDSSFNWAKNGYNLYNSFTVDNGQIVSAKFATFASEGSLYLNVDNYLNLYHKSDGNVMNFGGFNSILFTPVTGGADTAAVPEPSQVAASLLLAAGIAGFVSVKRRKEASELEALAS